jgi:hypothetical protein
VQADPASSSGEFAKGLLNPASPVPTSVKGAPRKRYAVYRNNVTVSLIRAMESNFPVVRRLLGEQYFAGLAREFVQNHPPRSPLMFLFGEDFASYLELQEDLHDYPYLGDIARLEQQMRVSYHEADAPCVSAQDLAQISEPELMQAVFVAHPAAALLQSQFAIHSIYAANQGGTVSPVESVASPEAVLVSRPGHDVELHELNKPNNLFLTSLVAGNSLGKATEAAFETNEEFDLASGISLLLTSGAFQSIQSTKV